MRVRRGDELELTIDRLAHGGDGVGRADGLVVFVPFAAPGDRLRVRVRKSRRRHAEADIVEVLEPGAGRTEAPCPLFGRCGGCAWQHLDDDAQAAAKESIVRESFEHLGGMTDVPLEPIVRAPETLHYRNKMEFAFHPESIVGLHRRGRWDEVLPVEHCLLADARAETVLSVVRSFVLERGLTCWNTRTHEGMLRHLVFRESRATGRLMVALVTAPDPFPDGPELARRLVAAVPSIASVLWAQTSARADAVTVERLEVLHGEDHLVETLGGIEYRIHLETFFQTNTGQAERLAGIVRELAALTGGETVIDVFCGVGTFSLLLAAEAAEVHGIEVVERSIEAAKENARHAGIENVRFRAGDARRTLPKVLEVTGTPDLVLLDPPRSGAGGKVMRRIGRSGAKRVLYVSCNPTTLAPDLEQLLPFGYTLRTVRPVDLFPQTWHVECVALLEKTHEPASETTD